jgi:hypothetical protein
MARDIQNRRLILQAARALTVAGQMPLPGSASISGSGAATLAQSATGLGSTPPSRA